MLREINEYLEERLEVVKDELGILEEAFKDRTFFENEKIRVIKAEGDVAVFDLRNAGKRGKKVEIFVLYATDRIKDPKLLKALNRFYKSISVIGDYDKLFKLASKIMSSVRRADYPGSGRIPGINVQYTRGVKVKMPVK